MQYNGLRGFIDEVERVGELRVARGCDIDQEVGARSPSWPSTASMGPRCSSTTIQGYPPGHRVFINSLGSASRTALALGLPTGLACSELVPLWRERMKEISLIPMAYVNDGPVMENVHGATTSTCTSSRRRCGTSSTAAATSARAVLDITARSGQRLGQPRHLPRDAGRPESRGPLHLAGQARPDHPRQVLRRAASRCRW